MRGCGCRRGGRLSSLATAVGMWRATTGKKVLFTRGRKIVVYYAP